MAPMTSNQEVHSGYNVSLCINLSFRPSIHPYTQHNKYELSARLTPLPYLTLLAKKKKKKKKKERKKERKKEK